MRENTTKSPKSRQLLTQVQHLIYTLKNSTQQQQRLDRQKPPRLLLSYLIITAPVQRLSVLQLVLLPPRQYQLQLPVLITTINAITMAQLVRNQPLQRVSLECCKTSMILSTRLFLKITIRLTHM